MSKCKMLVCLLLSLLLVACVKNTHPEPREPRYAPGTESELRQGKRLFEQQRFHEAMRVLLPLACDCIAEAEYAVGYMYYYGYGVDQDNDMGRFWIRRSAQHGYPPARDALRIMEQDRYRAKSKLWP